MPMTPQQLAEACAATLWGPDTCSQWLGMQLEEVRPGYARISMKVRPEFLNGHGICHGGLMFTLADSTFAFACNSHNAPTVAAGCSIEFLKPVQGSDTLTAVGQEQTMSGRHGIYDIRVTNAAGEVVAMFRGKSAQLKGEIVPNS
jgi:acyl-CoA thioesterase